MTATLIAELLILTVGTHMDSDPVKEFCTFAKDALIVDYILELTFVIAVLSIDIKRVEVIAAQLSLNVLLLTIRTVG